MEITNKTKTFAQDGRSFILTNDARATFENFFEIKAKGCVINFDEETISPELPIAVLTRFSSGWDVPDRQITPEEVKDFRRTK